MWLGNAVIRESGLHGKGVFSLKFVPKGRILSVWQVREVLREEEYLARAESEPEVRRNSVRLVGKYYGYEPGGTVPEDYINHSYDPNLLYHVGVYIALKDISPGEELTVDYNHYFNFDRTGHLTDRTSGAVVHGLSPKESLIRNCQAVIALVREIENWDGN